MKLRLVVVLYFLIFHLAAISQTKPNVILILSDDQGWGDLSLHGNPWLKTPNLDNLAKSGQRFTNFYVSPLCAPTRAGILTGRYHLKTGVVSVSKGLEIMDTGETTLAEVFKANGYATGIFGKWHNGQHYPNRPNDQGFDEFLGFCAGHWSNYFDTKLEHNNQTISTKGYITDVLTDAALQFIKTNQQKPFLCYIPYNAPHSPHQVPDKYFDKYKAKGLDNELSGIYGMVENLDDNVGRVLEYLKANHLEENTIVIFLSDNGPNGIRYNGVMKGIKGSVHEGGVHVPFFISWKNHVPAGTINETPLQYVDLFPTLSALCQLKPITGKPLDGVSFAGLALGDSSSFKIKRNLYTHVNFMQVPVTPNAGGFRNRQYRFVFEKDSACLYDLIKDPGELHDLSKTEAPLLNQYLSNYQQWFNQSVKDVQYDRPIVISKMGVALPTYEASLSSGIKFKEGHGWAHDWIAEWNSTTDSIIWEVDCQTPGKYKVELEYLCNKEDIGSVVECTVGKERKTFTINQPFKGEQLPSPDRTPRKEAYEIKEWKKLLIGTFNLKAGRQFVKLKATHIAHHNVAEINGIQFTYIR